MKNEDLEFYHETQREVQSTKNGYKAKDKCVKGLRKVRFS